MLRGGAEWYVRDSFFERRGVPSIRRPHNAQRTMPFRAYGPFRCLCTALQLSARVESARRSGPTEQLHFRELRHGNYRRMCWPSRSDDSFARCAPESHNVPLTDIVRIHQDLGLGPATEDCVARVLRVLQDRANRAALPSVREPVTILVRPTRRGTRNTITVQPFGDRPIALAVEVIGEDPTHDICCFLIDCEYP